MMSMMITVIMMIMGIMMMTAMITGRLLPLVKCRPADMSKGDWNWCTHNSHHKHTTHTLMKAPKTKATRPDSC